MSTLFTTLLLPLIAGYIVLTRVPFLKYRALQYTSYKLVIASTICGLALLYLSNYLLTMYYLLYDIHHYENIKQIIHDIVIKPFSLIEEEHHTPTISSDNSNNRSFVYILTIYISLIYLGMYKLVEKCLPNYFEKISLIEQTAASPKGPLEKMLQASFDNEQPIMVTLKNRKVYIGIVTELPPPSHDDSKKHIKIIPVYSGYRQNKDHKYLRTVNYKFLVPLLKTYSKQLTLTPLPKKNKTAKVKITHKKRSIIVDATLFELMANNMLVIEKDEIITASLWIEEMHELFN